MIREINTKLQSLFQQNGVKKMLTAWPYVMNEGEMHYPCALIVPPTMKQGSAVSPQLANAYREYELSLYLFGLNYPKGKDKQYTHDEKLDVWDSQAATLEQVIYELHKSLDSNGSIRYLVVGGYTITPDEDSIGNEGLIWQKAQLTLRINGCR